MNITTSLRSFGRSSHGRGMVGEASTTVVQFPVGSSTKAFLDFAKKMAAALGAQLSEQDLMVIAWTADQYWKLSPSAGVGMPNDDEAKFLLTSAYTWWMDAKAKGLSVAMAFKIPWLEIRFWIVPWAWMAHAALVDWALIRSKLAEIHAPYAPMLTYADITAQGGAYGAAMKNVLWDVVAWDKVPWLQIPWEAIDWAKVNPTTTDVLNAILAVVKPGAPPVIPDRGGSGRRPNIDDTRPRYEDRESRTPQEDPAPPAPPPPEEKKTSAVPMVAGLMAAGAILGAGVAAATSEKKEPAYGRGIAIGAGMGLLVGGAGALAARR